MDTLEASARELIAAHLGQIAQERAFTIDRIERLRKFVRNDAQLKERERAEWITFHNQVRPIELEIETMVKLLAERAILQAPSPTYLEQGDVSDRLANFDDYGNRIRDRS